MSASYSGPQNDRRSRPSCTHRINKPGPSLHFYSEHVVDRKNKRGKDGPVPFFLAPVATDARLAGTFTITSTFTNTSTDTFSNLLLTVKSLTGGNVLCNADGGPGGAGATLMVPEVGGLGDGQLSPLESFGVELRIGLQSYNRFTFLVDVFGEAEAP